VPAPTCLVLPGFLDPAGGTALHALAECLVTAGMTVVADDPRGTWSSPGTPADLAPTVQLADITAQIDARPAGRVVLVGHCYGAYLAMLAAARDDRVTDVVAIMPTRCFIWPDDYTPARDTWRAAGNKLFLRTAGGERRTFAVPYSVVEDAVTHDLPTAVRQLRQRILFVAGEHDRVIGVEPVRKLHEECGSLDNTLAVLPLWHDYRDEPEQIEIVNRRIMSWLGG
jgi:pimeloyl-ACP methyl ester carboxylesterase